LEKHFGNKGLKDPRPKAARLIARDIRRRNQGGGRRRRRIVTTFVKQEKGRRVSGALEVAELD
jgi:hypothetical protein